MNEAQYYSSIHEFYEKSEKEILGQIFSEEQYDATTKTREAWTAEIRILKSSLQKFKDDEHAFVFFEYTIPRVDGRIDCGLIIHGCLFVIEFKTGEQKDGDLSTYHNQLLQYAVDLKNFHFESYDFPLIPVLLIESSKRNTRTLSFYDENAKFYNIATINENGLAYIIDAALSENSNAKVIDPIQWLHSPYCPTSDIVEAARQLYDHHTVADIRRSDAKGENLVRTTDKIMSLIHQAKKNHEKYLCMITGVPGAGKTLIGLSVATEYKNEEHLNHSVYLSGNHPLVTVLQEALAVDAWNKKKKELDEVLSKISDSKERKQYKKDHKVLKTDSESEVKQFIQMIYLWRREYLKGIKVEGRGKDAHIIKDDDYYNGKGESFIPYDHVAVFDEAQRTWNASALVKDVKKKFGGDYFPMWSEARFLISCMDRHPDWGVIVCLIGNGQDINHDEAGIADWIESIKHFPNWKVYAPVNFIKDVDCSKIAHQLVEENDLHLKANLRSIRAENVSAFVDALLLPEAEAAGAILKEIDHYPIVLTRDFDTAKTWLKNHAHKGDRYGVIASSKAQRLRPLAIDVSHSKELNVKQWFLGNHKNVHSSYYMEDIATEFQIQGLEIDWACVAWDGDFLYQDNHWVHRRFITSGWQNINKDYLQNYQTNAYRVLLTRARRGMIIFVPEGDRDDATRKKEYYDGTYEYLRSIGIPEI